MGRWASHQFIAFWVNVCLTNYVASLLFLWHFQQVYSLLSPALTSHPPYSNSCPSRLWKRVTTNGGEDEISLGHVFAFPSKPVLLTNKTQSGIGHSFPLQGYPALPANMVSATCSEFCLQVLRTKSHDTRTTCQLYISATTAC